MTEEVKNLLPEKPDRKLVYILDTFDNSIYRPLLNESFGLNGWEWTSDLKKAEVVIFPDKEDYNIGPFMTSLVTDILPANRVGWTPIIDMKWISIFLEICRSENPILKIGVGAGGDFLVAMSGIPIRRETRSGEDSQKPVESYLEYQHEEAFWKVQFQGDRKTIWNPEAVSSCIGGNIINYAGRYSNNYDSLVFGIDKAGILAINVPKNYNNLNSFREGEDYGSPVKFLSKIISRFYKDYL